MLPVPCFRSPELRDPLLLTVLLNCSELEKPSNNRPGAGLQVTSAYCGKLQVWLHAASDKAPVGLVLFR